MPAWQASQFPGKKVCLQQLSDLNLEAITSKDEEAPKPVICTEMSVNELEEKKDIPVPSVKLLRSVANATQTDHDLRFDLNPYNKCITK